MTREKYTRTRWSFFLTIYSKTKPFSLHLSNYQQKKKKKSIIKGIGP